MLSDIWVMRPRMLVKPRPLSGTMRMMRTTLIMKRTIAHWLSSLLTSCKVPNCLFFGCRRLGALKAIWFVVRVQSPDMALCSSIEVICGMSAPPLNNITNWYMLWRQPGA